MHSVHTSVPIKCGLLLLKFTFSSLSTFVSFQNHNLFLTMCLRQQFSYSLVNLYPRICIFFSSSLLNFHWFVLVVGLFGFFFCYFQRCVPADLKLRGQLLEQGAEKGHLSHIFALLVTKGCFQDRCPFLNQRLFSVTNFLHWKYSPFHILINNIDENHGNLKMTDNFTVIRK